MAKSIGAGLGAFWGGTRSIGGGARSIPGAVLGASGRGHEHLRGRGQEHPRGRGQEHPGGGTTAAAGGSQELASGGTRSPLQIRRVHRGKGTARGPGEATSPPPVPQVMEKASTTSSSKGIWTSSSSWLFTPSESRGDEKQGALGREKRCSGGASFAGWWAEGQGGPARRQERSTEVRHNRPAGGGHFISGQLLEMRVDSLRLHRGQ